MAVHKVPVEPSGHIGAHIRLAIDHADMGTEIPADARLRSVKQTIARANRMFTHHQVLFNHAVLDALSEVDAALGDAPGSTRGATALSAMEVMLQDLEDEVDALRADNEALRSALVDLQSASRAAAADTRVLRTMLDTTLREIRGERSGGDTAEAAAVARLLSARNDDLYAAFEQTFRGTRESVQMLCKPYVDELAVAAAGGGRVVDIGCGRGELLELLRDAGVDAYGVDLSDRFVSEGAERDLEILHADGIAHLGEVEEGSLAAVTAIQVAEHLGLDALVDLVDLSLRALRPGGVLLLETPNPMTWQVGANWFYLDPTHIKPLHPMFLEFLVTARGFVDVEVRYLHPAADAELAGPAVEDGPLLGQLVDRVNEVYAGPQDFAVLGTKPSPTS